MKEATLRSTKTLLVLVLAIGVMGLVAGTATAVDPVTAKITVTGDAKPGATITAKAVLTITNGSTLQSIKWTQNGGATATVTNGTTDTITAVLADRKTYKEHLIEILGKAPLDESMPAHQAISAMREEEFFGGLQNRFQVVGSTPLSIEEAGHLAFDITVVTSSGTYHVPAAIASMLPWTPATGLRNVAIGIPVIMHAKTQATYDWKLTLPTGSTATLSDATVQSPEFTPEVAGLYKLTVTDLADPAKPKVVTLDVYAGKWQGQIVGQDTNGRPKSDTACLRCHVEGTPLGQFAAWANTGHAEIFKDNLNTSTHYGESCLSCHTVGYDPAVKNGGIDDATDWEGFVATGMLHKAAADNWSNTLNTYPATAKLANIQCENCHGPQMSDAHFKAEGSRTTLSSDVCGTCHGEPLRHGRFQQWQLSGHANYELAGEEGMSGSCSKCHTANGFIAWVNSGFQTADLKITWTKDDVHPQTCQACHDPHDIGTTSGGPTTNAKVRITGDTPLLMAGFKATNVGRGALCMTCHNARRDLRNDSNFNIADGSRAPHLGTQADMLMGQNLYFAEVNKPGYHSKVEDSCVTCHMEATPPPAELSYQLGGTNHAFVASKEACSKCHKIAKAHDVQGPVEAKLATIKGLVESGILNLMKAQIAAGNAIDMGGKAKFTNATDVVSLALVDASGRQAITATLANGTTVGPIGMNSVKVVPPTGTAVELYRFGSPNLPKAGWNYLVVESDGSFGVHNPGWINTALDNTIKALTGTTGGEGGTDAGLGGGLGNGAGAVACTTPYVYWAEVVSHATGNNSSLWRSDILARNLATSAATLRFVLHTAAGDVQGTGAVPAASQGVFPDIVAMLGASTKGSLEICSDKPLLVLGRTFNQATSGTYGQFIDGHVANLGLSSGQFADLLGLRQETGKYRTNINIANGSKIDGQVSVTLFGNDGKQLISYNLAIPAGKVVQDLEPFRLKAGKPDIGFGFATVKVLSGSNIRTSGSVVDAVTNDPTTVPPKR